MNVLVTGGAGFIGSHIVDRYLTDGNRVVVVDNLSSGKIENVNSAAEFHKLDVREPELAQVFEKNQFDLINHHAAQMDVRVSVEDPIYDANVNIIGLLNLLENCRKYEVNRFVFVSSGGVVYGETEDLPAWEGLPKLPLSPYGVSKHASEQYLFYYHKIHRINYVAIRYSNVFGPRQDPHGEAGVVAIFSKRLLKNEPVTVFGNGEQQRDYVFVDDVVQANMLLGDAMDTLIVDSPDDASFNVGTGVPTTVNKLADLLSGIAGVDTKPTYEPVRDGELFRNFLNNEKIRSRCQWEPSCDIEVGLKKTLEWFRSQRV